MRRFERYGRLRLALRAEGAGLGAHSGPGRLLPFAVLAAFGIVLELFVVKEELLAGGKHKFTTAIGAFQCSVYEIHTALSPSFVCNFRDKKRQGAKGPDGALAILLMLNA